MTEEPELRKTLPQCGDPARKSKEATSGLEGARAGAVSVATDDDEDEDGDEDAEPEVGKTPDGATRTDGLLLFTLMPGKCAHSRSTSGDASATKDTVNLLPSRGSMCSSKTWGCSSKKARRL